MVTSFNRSRRNCWPWLTNEQQWWTDGKNAGSTYSSVSISFMNIYLYHLSIIYILNLVAPFEIWNKQVLIIHIYFFFLVLEVYQFARDAAVAEAWLIAQEPYLLSRELGHTIDEVDQLIKKHESFEKSAAAQEERFTALERLTTVIWIFIESILLIYTSKIGMFSGI